MIYTYKLLNSDEYSLYDEYNQKYTYTRKIPVNEELKDNRNKFVFKYNLTDYEIDFGEVIGSILARRTIRNGCFAELTKKPIVSLKKESYSYGVSSFFYTSKSDKIIVSQYFMREYFKKENFPKELYSENLADIDTVLKAMHYGIVGILKRPYSEYENFKQQYIDMIMFDCRFGNYDRRIDNWMLYQDGQTGEIKMYPMFDNEAILGVDTKIDNFRSNLHQLSSEEKVDEDNLDVKNARIEKEKQLILEYNLNLRMKEIIPEDIERGYSYSQDIIKHISQKYPNETQKAYKAVRSVTYEDLVILLDEFPELSEERKTLMKRMFLTRALLIDKQMDEIIKKQNLENIPCPENK